MIAGRRAWMWWLALAVPLWLVCIACTHWEPVLRDGWGHVFWYRFNHVTLDNLYVMVKDSYLYANPRLGQTFTLLLHAPGPYHVIITPLVELAMFGLLTTLALGRWPSVRRADDALVAATVVALVALCTPQFGPMLFYRPFTGNYLYGFVLNLIWLVPYRLHLERPRTGWWLAPAMLVLGVVAGMCNEHTGVAFLAMAAVAMVQAVRGGARLRIWMIAGFVGLAAGYVALLVAPGQAIRYNGLAHEAGIVGRILDRGVLENLWILGRLVVDLLPALAWLALGLAARRTHPAGERSALEPLARRALVALALGGVVCTFTLLASPKLGPRLYLASVALVCVAIAGWLCAQLRARRLRVACAILSACAVAYACVRCLVTYHAVADVGAERLHRIQAAAGTKSTVIVRRYPLAKGQWFLGDDFVGSAGLMENLAADYELAAIQLAPE